MSQVQKSDASGLNISPVDQKLLQALIESVLVANPSLEGQLTAAAVWQYLQMPDDVFGWSAGNGPMPTQIKVSLIITTLELGFTPGQGQIIWIGNKPYITAAARASYVARAKDVEVIGEQVFRPFNDDEKTMFGIKDGDLHCVVTQKHLVRGREINWIGHGAIGSDELTYRDRQGGKRPGLKTVKDTMQTLKTRAISDMNRRNYPVKGLNDSEGAGENNGEFDQTVTAVVTKIPPMPSAEEIESEVNRLSNVINLNKAETQKAGASVDAEEKAAYDAARARFARLRNQTVALKKNPDEVLELPEGEDSFNLLNTADTERLNDAADVLETWVDLYHAKAKAEPAPAPAPSGETKIQKRAGRPTKAQSRFKTLEGTAVELGGDVAKIIGVDPLEVYVSSDADRLNAASDTLEQWIIDNDRPPPGKAKKEKAAPPPPAPKKSSPPIKVELAPQTETLELEKALPPPPAPNWMPKPAPAIDEEDEEREPWDTGEAPADPLAEETELDFEMDWPEEHAAAEQLPAPDIYLGTIEQKEILKQAGLKAGLPNDGQHLLAIKMQGRPMSELPLHAETLRAHIEAEKSKAPEPAEEIQLPVMPTSGPGLQAYRSLERYLGDATVSHEVRLKVIELAGRRLRDGDHLYLPKAIREAKGGNFAALQELITSREAR